MVHVDSHKSSLTATEQGTFTAKWVTSVQESSLTKRVSAALIAMVKEPDGMRLSQASTLSLNTSTE